MPGARTQVTGAAPVDRNTTADRAIDVLLLFDDEHPVLSAVEVSERLGMSRSTTYRYLQSLRSKGLLEEDTSRGGFRLGPRIFYLARVARAGLGLPELALPVMQALADEVDEAVLLTRRSGTQVVCIERVESTHPVRLSYERGHILPINGGASAKILLAFAEPGEVEALLGNAPLQRYTKRTITDPRKLRTQLGEIRVAGYAVTDGELDEGVRGVAAPVFNAANRIVAGLSVAGPAFRLTDDVLPRVIAAVRASAAALTQRLTEMEA
jgi:DNA-binding IclR family transcriptional regulator